MPFLLILGLADFASGFTARAVDPLLNLLAADLNVSLQRAGLLATGFALPYAAMQLVFGPVGDAVGRVRLIRVTLSLLTLGHIASALASGHEVLLAARIFAGGCAGGIIPVALATVGDRVPLDRRPEALGRLLLAVVLGQLSGASLSGAIAYYCGWRMVFWVSTAISAAATFGAIFFLKETGARQKLSLKASLAGYGLVFRNPLSIRHYSVSAVEGGLVFGVMPFVAPLMVEHAFGDAVEAGIAVGCFAVGGVSYSFLVGWMIRRLGLSRMAGYGAVIAGCTLMAISLGASFALVCGLFVLLGFSFYMIHNTLQIMATELAPSARGSGISLFSTSFFTGQALGAAVAGQVLAWTGSTSLVFAGAGVGVLLLSWPASRLSKIRRQEPAAEPPEGVAP